MMERITGCGCSLGGVIAVYAAVVSPLIAAFCGTQLVEVATIGNLDNVEFERPELLANRNR